MEKFLSLFMLLCVLGIVSCVFFAEAAWSGRRRDLSGFYAMCALLAGLFGLWMGASALAIISQSAW